MAYIGGDTGNFTIADHKFDAGSFSIDARQAVDAAAVYANATWIHHQGSGAIEFSGTIGGFAKDNAASTNPNLDGLAPAGSAGTFTLNTATTYAASLVASRIQMIHARGSGLVPVVLDVLNGGDVTEVWDEVA